MDARRLARDAIVAFGSQGIALGLSVVTTLAVPKVLGLSQFGFWQLFMFYATYVGLFHFGLNDGVYLRYGGLSRQEADARAVASQFRVGMTLQSLIALGVALAALATDGGAVGERTFVVLAASVFLVVNNASLYWGYVFQALGETRRYSALVVVNRVAFFVPLVALLILRVDDFRFYVAAYVAAQTVGLAFCLAQARGLARGAQLPLRETLGEMAESVRTGIKLTVANASGLLVIGVARFAVDAAWGVETFGEVSLALSVASFFLLFASQVSMVLFPALRRADGKSVRRAFDFARAALDVVLPLLYVAYLPLAAALAWWLPAYQASVGYLGLLLPLCAYNARMDITCTTLFKVRREEGRLLRINAATLAVSVLGVALGAFVLRSVDAVLASVTVACMLRGVVSEGVLARELDARPDRARLSLTVFTGVYAAVASVLAAYPTAGFACLMGAYAVLLLVRRRDVVRLATDVRALWRRG